MQNKFLTENDIKQIFFASQMDNVEGYDLDELLDFADKVILTVAEDVARRERELCIDFVKSLNTEVAKALREKRGNL